MYFPRAILPLSAVLSSLVTFAFEFAVLMVAMLIFVGLPSWYVVWVPLILAITAMLAYGFALLLSALGAGTVAWWLGRRTAEIRDAAIGGVASAMGAIYILLGVGALIGTWNMAGTIPTVVDYGIRLLSPTWFYVTTAVICAVVGMVTGSSWTTAGTLGVAFVWMAKVLGLEEPIAAGATNPRTVASSRRRPPSSSTRSNPPSIPAIVPGGANGTARSNRRWRQRSVRSAAWRPSSTRRALARLSAPSGGSAG